MVVPSAYPASPCLEVLELCLCILDEQHVKSTMNVAKNNRIIAARIVHIPIEKTAWLPDPSLLTWSLIMPNRTKSHAMTTIVMIHVTAATIDAINAPMTPAPRARRNAMNARPQAMGWRIMTRVRAFDVSVDAALKVVWSICDMIAAGL